ncbi:Uncharacterized protein DB43_FJ00060 [Parachlamydia acanthamoebae]|uniref:Uncharacterized protein n=1 Tax=Parachlamydia acanthamoebae TaxID=83552 RepID=A0A0C1ECX1_9BACT|nr:Uncharacterized protein DB43_FJ00060 [Parachlamydia acanthamoebae]
MAIGWIQCLFFCLGASSVAMNKEKYKHITYDLTLNFGQLLARLNPEMTFCYVTGTGTDSREQGRTNCMGACKKGPPKMPYCGLFKHSYMFRPAFMKATPCQKNVRSYYKFFAWLYPIGRKLYPSGFCTCWKWDKL